MDLSATERANDPQWLVIESIAGYSDIVCYHYITLPGALRKATQLNDSLDAQLLEPLPSFKRPTYYVKQVKTYAYPF